MKRSYLFGALLLSTRLAWAGDPTTSDGWYEVGQTHFTLGEFDKAVDAFKKGFELETDDEKKPAYLYNIAQAYRQANDCKNSVFFYKRFIAMKANDAKKPLKPELRTEVEGWIKDGEDCIAKQEDLARTKPPDSTLSSRATRPRPSTRSGPRSEAGAYGRAKQVAVTDTGNNTTTVTSTTATTRPDTGVRTTVAARRRGCSRLRFVGGGDEDVSAGDLSYPGRARTGAPSSGGYPLPINDKLELVVGAAFTFTPSAPGRQHACPRARRGREAGRPARERRGARYAVAPKIGVRADVGLGVLVFSGLDQMGNPFTAGRRLHDRRAGRCSTCARRCRARLPDHRRTSPPR